MTNVTMRIEELRREERALEARMSIAGTANAEWIGDQLAEIARKIEELEMEDKGQ